MCLIRLITASVAALGSENARRLEASIEPLARAAASLACFCVEPFRSRPPTTLVHVGGSSGSFPT